MVRKGLGVVALVALLATACSGGPESGGADDAIMGSSSSTTTTPDSGDPTPSTTHPATTTTIPVPVFIDSNGFNDHTVPTIASVDEFHALARAANDRGVVKFSISDFSGEPEVRWADSNFYELHDEWYWYRLLNGQPVPGVADEPATGFNFESVDAIYEWADRLDGPLPVGLRWVESQTFGRNRLYSNRFYDLVLRTEPRSYAVGSLVRFPTAEDVHWLIELEYSDTPTPAELATILDSLGATLPEEISTRLQWVIRSPEQEAVAARLAADELPYHDRVTTYRDLVPAGEVAVYNEGITAGRLLFVDAAGTQLALAAHNDILVMEHVPDWLPPAAGIITSSPQTPLAHVNLLARNRGIPNVSLAGAIDNASLAQAARVRARVIMHAVDGELEIRTLDRADYRDWLARQEVAPIAVAAAGESDSIVIRLDTVTTPANDTDLDPWRRIIGGKATGFLTLMASGVTTPPTPAAITVDPYRRHLAQVETALGAVLDHPEFRDDPRARFLLLEGPDDYFETYGSERDVDFGEQLIAANPPGTILGDVVTADGFKKFFRARAMDSDDLSSITESLDQIFGDYAAGQGLRFRSSSTVEDIEGFSGAGLYDSNTGYLDERSGRPIEEAIKKTWASYWGFEAYEERARENVDHLSGAMAVLVHARFDDELELDNGVATVTLLPGGSAEVVVNVQPGAVSVTNPDPASSDVPEAVEIVVDPGGAIDIDRLQASSLSTGPVLTDEKLDELVPQLLAVATRWRAQINADLTDAQQVEVVTLDFEFKTMAEGWPAIDGEPALPSRLILKQARSLDPGLRGISDALLAAPIPRDLLARTELIERFTCGAETIWRVTPDPLSASLLALTEPVVIPAGADFGSCQRQVVLRSPDQFLRDLLEAGSGTVLVR